jgi:hypothetical protein
MSIPETGVTSVKLTANIEGYVDEPSNDCDGTGKPFPLPDGEAVVTNGSDTQILTRGGHTYMRSTMSADANTKAEYAKN